MSPAPPQLDAIREDALELGFAMSSDELTGRLLSTLAASKPGGRMLELGTGVGFASAWLLWGMDASSTLITVDNNPRLSEIAKKHLGQDARITIRTEDGLSFLKRASTRFDLIFADTWPGKLERPELALDLLNPGGFYVVDDMNDVTGLPAAVPGVDDETLRRIPEQWARLIATLESRPHLRLTKLHWSTGLIIATRLAA
jgi:predicted O-methyltransferase YrrM